MRNSLPVVLAAAILPVLAPSSLPARQAPQAGSLEGRVVLTRELSARRPRFRLYAEHGGQPVPAGGAGDTLEYGNVVIYIDSASGPAPAAQPDLRIRQVNETFLPHVLPVLVGSTVRFPNEDPFFHNVFSLSRARTFDLGRFPQGASKSVVFNRAGVVQVFCHIHSDMTAVILVRDNPFFTVPDGDGRFRLDGIPPGTYRAVVWHERIRPYAASVTISPGQATGIEFTIPLTERGDH